MSGLHVVSIEDTREAAMRRIHAEEQERLEAALVIREIERANAKTVIRSLCAQFTASEVALWVIEAAKSLGQTI